MPTKYVVYTDGSYSPGCPVSGWALWGFSKDPPRVYRRSGAVRDAGAFTAELWAVTYALRMFGDNAEIRTDNQRVFALLNGEKITVADEERNAVGEFLATIRGRRIDSMLICGVKHWRPHRKYHLWCHRVSRAAVQSVLKRQPKTA